MYIKQTNQKKKAMLTKFFTLLVNKAVFTRSVKSFLRRGFFVSLLQALSVKNFQSTMKNFRRASKKQKTLGLRNFLRYV